MRSTSASVLRCAVASAALLCGLGVLRADVRPDVKVALVVGNSGYSADVLKLKNASRDARDIKEALEKDNFKVDLEIDVSEQKFREALGDFERKSKDADISLFYYAGHGMQYHRKNFLLPADVFPRDIVDVKRHSIALDDIVDAASEARKSKIVILDACRDGKSGPNKPQTRSLGGLGDGDGLAAVDGADGLVVFFSAQHGKQALDTDGGDHSPFAESMLRHVVEPGRAVLDVLSDVERDVSKATNGGQEPEIMTASLGKNEIVLNPKESSAEAWRKAKQANDPKVIKQFMLEYPDSPEWDTASLTLDKLDADKRELERNAEAQKRIKAAEDALAAAQKQADERQKFEDLRHKRDEDEKAAAAKKLADIETQRKADQAALEARLAEAKRQADEKLLEQQKLDEARIAEAQRRAEAAKEERKQAEEARARQAEDAAAKTAEAAAKVEEAREAAAAAEAAKQREAEQKAKEAQAAAEQKTRDAQAADERKAQEQQVAAEKTREAHAATEQMVREAEAAAEQKRKEAQAAAEQRALEAQAAAEKTREALAAAEQKAREAQAAAEAARVAQEAQHRAEMESEARIRRAELADAQRQREEEARILQAKQEADRRRQEEEAARRRNIEQACIADLQQLATLKQAGQADSIEILRRDSKCPTFPVAADQVIKQITAAAAKTCQDESKKLTGMDVHDAAKFSAAAEQFKCEAVRTAALQKLDQAKQEQAANEAVCAQDNVKIAAIDLATPEARAALLAFGGSKCAATRDETDKLVAEIDARVSDAQIELARLGCLESGAKSKLFDAATVGGLRQYFVARNAPTESPRITEGLIDELSDQQFQVCTPPAPVIVKSAPGPSPSKLANAPPTSRPPEAEGPHVHVRVLAAPSPLRGGENAHTGQRIRTTPRKIVEADVDSRPKVKVISPVHTGPKLGGGEGAGFTPHYQSAPSGGATMTNIPSF